MKKVAIIRLICIGGMLTALTVLFQSAPVFLPMLGLVLSPISTLPIAIAAITNIFLGFSVLFSSALILTIISIQETMILLFTTGLLGVVMGSFIYRKSFLVSTLFSSIALSLGIIFLTYIVGIPSFIDLAGSLSAPFILFLFFSFSLVYASIWNVILKKIVHYFVKIKFLN